MKFTTTVLSSLALSLSAMGGTPAPMAPPMATAPASDGWWFRAAPYAWVSAIEGDVTVGPLTAPVDISMSDTLKSVDMTYMGILEAGYGRWSFGVDVVYGKTSQDIAAGGHLFDSFRYEQKQWLITPTVAFRAVETDDYHMDVYAGAMFTVLEADITGRFARGGEIAVGRNADWVDPIIGIRGQSELTDKVFFRYNAYVGGFGVSSDLVWQAFAGIGYHVSDACSIAIGYRGIGIDYANGNFALDTVTHGPVIGLELRF
jgi:opacity protein-like surface antigen